MSKIGKKSIQIPKDVNITFNEGYIDVKGPIGAQKIKLDTKFFDFDIDDKKNLSIKPKKLTDEIKKIWGMNRSLVNNAVNGVNKGFEIILDNIPETRKKIRENKPQFIISDYQKVTRDFAFVIEEKFSSGEVISLVKNIDKELIKAVKIFDVYQGENIELGKKSIAFNVTLEPKNKTLSDKDIEEVSKKIISKVENITGAILRS